MTSDTDSDSRDSGKISSNNFVVFVRFCWRRTGDFFLYKRKDRYALGFSDRLISLVSRSKQ